ncbi:MAG: hypothetical protein JSV10_10360 [Candidatus Zixiibacteriota bacterium]|nr:MAG: hypothetical protein JSV10_10360 [candidate division Zixibacteria bacterium]
MRLYHISDRPGIRRFEPRLAPSKSAKQQGLMVWAIDYEHLHNYLLPRDCPRVTFFAKEDSDPKDVERLMAGSSAEHVVAVEARWLPEIRKQCIFQYEFDSQDFTCVDEIAGYWISREPVVPIAETKIDDVPAALLEHDVELRIMCSLWKLREAVIHSTLGFSIIRMHKAQPPPEGYEAYHPLP